jgi:hypothetical protein
MMRGTDKESKMPELSDQQSLARELRRVERQAATVDPLVALRCE